MAGNSELSLEQASAIVADYGEFLEICNGPLMELFHAAIPESLLPYPKDTINEACQMVERYWRLSEEKEMAESIASARAGLLAYVSSEEAIDALEAKAKDEVWRKAIIPKLGNRQKRQLERRLSDI